ncbi:MAG: hypothetical protein H6618_00770 [Deltaproteobacteria bacterium]|nr:hypothetical protein [Deltaproteobacteria bacterium]
MLDSVKRHTKKSAFLSTLGTITRSSVAKRHLVAVAMILFSSYVLAGVTASFLVPVLLKSALSAGDHKGQRSSGGQLNLQRFPRPNFHKLKKSVLDRNLFNQDGQYPEEEAIVEAPAKSSSDFSMDGPCLPLSIQLTLVGTIVLSDSKQSMATIREGNFDADVYREGDSVVGYDNITIVKIDRNRVIFNNEGAKECLEIKTDAGDRLFIEKASPQHIPQDKPETKSVELSSTFVESELGEGFTKIIQAARLVPNMEGDRVNGFRMFAIKKDSLLDKIGFQDGDVITQVNDTVMEAEQGFVLYQALLDERDLSIRVLRKGKTPVTLSVRIKS